eukprot:scaffold91150_cov20-Tisochrysis_lutea.AAC.3
MSVVALLEEYSLLAGSNLKRPPNGVCWRQQGQQVQGGGGSEETRAMGEGTREGEGRVYVDAEHAVHITWQNLFAVTLNLMHQSVQAAKLSLNPSDTHIHKHSPLLPRCCCCHALPACSGLPWARAAGLLAQQQHAARSAPGPVQPAGRSAGPCPDAVDDLPSVFTAGLEATQLFSLKQSMYPHPTAVLGAQGGPASPLWFRERLLVACAGLAPHAPSLWATEVRTPAAWGRQRFQARWPMCYLSTICTLMEKSNHGAHVPGLTSRLVLWWL